MAFRVQLDLESDRSVSRDLAASMASNRLGHLEASRAKADTKRYQTSAVARVIGPGVSTIFAGGRKKPGQIQGRRKGRGRRGTPPGRLMGELPMPAWPDFEPNAGFNRDGVPYWRGRILSDKGYERYGVIRAMTGYGCGAANLINYPISTAGNLLRGDDLEIRRWVRRGGTLFVQNEHSPAGDIGGASFGCGYSSRVLNAYLGSVFGEEMTAKFGTGDWTNGDSEQSFLDWNLFSNGGWDVYSTGAGNRETAPVYKQDRFARNTGGRVLYTNDAGVPYMSYSRIGRGAVVLVADSDSAQDEPARRLQRNSQSLYEVSLAIGGRRATYTDTRQGPSQYNGTEEEYRLYFPEWYT